MLHPVERFQGWNVLHIPNGDLHDAQVYEKVVQEAPGVLGLGDFAAVD